MDDKSRTRYRSRWLAVALALAAVALFPFVAEAETSAGATEVSAEYKILKDETAIEQLTNDYKDAQEKLARANEEISAIQSEMDALEQNIPVQQERSDRAVKAQYKAQSEPLAILEVLFKADSLNQFLKQAEYIERVSEANLTEMSRLLDMKEECDIAQQEQQRIKSEADGQVESAAAKLSAEQEKRAIRQATGLATSVTQARTQGGKKSVGVAYDGGEQPEDYKEAATKDTAALSDGADWYSDRDEFIAEWAERIDAYLKGSAMEGQGANFAKAAWKYNIDPRWSPAISNTESSKGAVCIRPHNAWGWGAADVDPHGLALEWKSWEEAIDAHVKGLSNGYGYTISMNGAKKYCPNTWQSWYNKTLAQMSKI